FMVGTVLAVVAGALQSPMLGVTPSVGLSFLAPAFFAVLVGKRVIGRNVCPGWSRWAAMVPNIRGAPSVLSLVSLGCLQSAAMCSVWRQNEEKRDNLGRKDPVSMSGMRCVAHH